ncbi:uncharacterized protein LOC111265414 isoform X1 [Varroa jacobsoni]|uniref:uncharacterized protein LOC111265414 isoform X1 n=1 Tax=Varroa jacobsoni TaxID=62625 RepID=UPI000BF7D0A9|nr:uncharacterized protein LOC111265414 isoform X1 [Varroa jacobsoni]
MTLTRVVSVERATAGLLRANFPFCSLMVGIVRKNNGANGTYQFAAAIHKSAVCALKKIVHREENGVTVIEGTFVDSPHKEKLLRPAASAIETETRSCSLCSLGIHDVKHTDVLIISQFMDRNGNILPQKVTGLCFRQHKLISLRLYEAQRCGLIPSEVHKPNERWQELNNYFGITKTKVDFGKPKIDIRDFLKKPSNKKVWE